MAGSTSTKKQVALDLAAFLDSDEARALVQEPVGIPKADVAALVEMFLSVCYDELGKKPKLLDGHDVHGALGHLMPARLARKDPRAAHAGAVLGAFFDHLESSEVVTQAYEIRRSLEATLPEFLDTVRTGENAHHHAPKQAPFVHKAEKLGRNDPCSCGSGKKYKKCHGKGA